MESASYMESNNGDVQENFNHSSPTPENIIEEYTPKLFSEEQTFQEEVKLETSETIERETEELFDQDLNEEEDFEIPAFLRKQKF
jgi:hypothetical protein